MPDGKKISEYEWKKRFDNEWYYAGRKGKRKIMTDPNHKKETDRNNNLRKRDALYSSEIKDGLIEYNDHAQFMEDANDEWDWQNAFKQGGYELAAKVIYDQTLKDLTNKNIDNKVTLTRFLIKIMNLKTLERREKRK